MSGKEFKQLLDQATNGTSSEPNWAVIMEIVEIIKRKDFAPKKASSEIRKKILDSKESVVLNSLHVTEAVVKNTPASIHKEFLTPELLGSMKALVEGQNTTMSKAIDKVLEILGEWKAAFGDDAAYKGIHNTFNELERGGYYIPQATIASASYMQKAPDFEESEICYLCYKEFGKGLYKGRHHCRNCGKSVCGSCMGENKVALPHFGVDTPQKVCITCLKKLDKPSESTEGGSHDDPSEGFRGGPSPQPPPSTQPSNQQELELQEQEDLEMAIAISLNEQENKKKSTTKSPSSSAVTTTGNKVTTSTTLPSAPPPSLYTPIYADLDFSSTQPTTTTTTVPAVSEFEQYTTRGKQEREKVTETRQVTTASTTEQPTGGKGTHTLSATLRQLMEQFTQRMQQVTNRGGSIATDPAILSMHQDLTAMHLQLLQQIDDTQEKKADQERVIHKLEEAKEARITFDAMRRRHREQLLQQEREQQALAEMQVQMKLALLRQQKAEQMAYGQSMQSERLSRLNNQRFEYERNLASQREQERQKLMTLEENVFQQQFGQEVSQGATTTPYVAPPITYGGPPPGPSMIPSHTDPQTHHGGLAPTHHGGLVPTHHGGLAPTHHTGPLTLQGVHPTLQGGPPTLQGGPLTLQGGPPPSLHVGPPPTLQGGSSFQADPLPPKIEPPPYQSQPPSLYQPSLYQPTSVDPPAATAQLTLGPIHDYIPPQSYYSAPPPLAQQPYTMLSSTDMPLYQSNGAPPPAPHSEFNQLPSEPPLISFD